MSVAISGIGMHTGFGSGTLCSWESIASGHSCIRPKDIYSKAEEPDRGQFVLKDDWILHIGLQCAREALFCAGLASISAGMRVFLGTNVGRVGILDSSPVDSLAAFLHGDFMIQWADHHRLARDLAGNLSSSAPAIALTGACASGSLALGHAFDCISSGQSELALAGGIDKESAFKASGHKILGSASPSGNICPFDVSRDGTGFRSGAAFLVLESLASCLKRGHRPFALISGYGVATDTGSLTAPDSQGKGAKNAMLAAMRDGHCSQADIDHIQAHGTGTILNDLIEARAIQEVFGDALESRVSISADKGAIGHTYGASGAISVGLMALMLEKQQVLPTVGCEVIDPECKLPLVMHEPLAKMINRSLCNNFGFGGGNVCILLERFRA